MANKKFESWAELTTEFRRIEHDLPRAKLMMLTGIGTDVVKDIQENILGRITPLSATGPFPAWMPLKSATIERKERYGLGKGGDPNSMLWATGDLARSISYTVRRGRNQVVIGSTSLYAAVHEYGSVHIPPRPYLGPGLFRQMPKALHKMEKLLHATLVGNKQRWS